MDFVTRVEGPHKFVAGYQRAVSKVGCPADSTQLNIIESCWNAESNTVIVPVVVKAYHAHK